MSSPPNFFNQMAPFWDFIADLEQQGPAHPWFGRRANRTANTEAAAEGNAKPWTERGAGFPLNGEMPLRPRRGQGNGPAGRFGRRQQQAQATEQNEKTEIVTPQTDKPVVAETFPAVQPEEVSRPHTGPGARRGGRGGRGGLGRARQAGLGRELATAEATLPTDTEAQRGPGLHRGGRGGRGMNHGFGRGMGGAGRGLGQRMGPRMRRRMMNQLLFELMQQEAAMGPQRPGAMRGMRGGRGMGRGQGRGANAARNVALAPGAVNQQVANGPQQGMRGRGGAGCRGGRGNGLGRGRGAALNHTRGPAAAGSAMNVEAGPATTPARNGPAGRGQNRQGPNARLGGPRMRRFGPNAVGLQQTSENKNKDVFHPKVDVYDHPDAFIIHTSLPGAKKEAVEVSWDAEKSVLRITGRIERPGDEDFLKTLSKSERKVGPFDREVRLGKKDIPAQVDAEIITARMEDGVLKIEVPKLSAGFVEVKKVDIN